MKQRVFYGKRINLYSELFYSSQLFKDWMYLIHFTNLIVGLNAHYINQSVSGKTAYKSMLIIC